MDKLGHDGAVSTSTDSQISREAATVTSAAEIAIGGGTGLPTSYPGKRRIPGWARLISPIVLIVLWQLGSSTGVIPATKLDSPVTIVHEAYILITTNSPTYGTLQESLLVSFERWIVGCAIGIVIGVEIGRASCRERV